MYLTAGFSSEARKPSPVQVMPKTTSPAINAVLGLSLSKSLTLGVSSASLVLASSSCLESLVLTSNPSASSVAPMMS